MSTALIRKRTLSPDSAGNYRPYIGWRRDETGKRIQHRFNLGCDRKEAERRYTRIQELFADDCQDSGCDVWSLRGLSFAKRMASGETPIKIAGPSYRDPRAVVEYQQGIEMYRRTFPSADIQPADLEHYTDSAGENRKIVMEHIAALEAKLKSWGALLATSDLPPDRIVSGSFYDVLDAYLTAYQDNAPKLPSGKFKPSTVKEGQWIEALKKAHQDFPLFELTNDKITALVSHWRNRPKTMFKDRSSKSYAEHQIKVLFRVFRWLDASNKFAWHLPKGIDSVPRKIEKLPAERKLSAMTKVVYSPAELATISATATDWQRLALYLGLNCGMGAAELGRLEIEDFALMEIHPFAKQLGIKSTAKDSWLRYFRPKTDVFGEWKLWPETVELVAWGIERAKHCKSKLIFCRKGGSPLYDVECTNPQQGFANLWTRMKKQAGIKDGLPFGSLRDTLPDYLRQVYSSEVSSMCLTHGTPGVDQLIDCYANKPWNQFHKTVMESHANYAPLWKVHVKPTT